jgi:UDP-N-acetylmuramate dehydrogenase
MNLPVDSKLPIRAEVPLASYSTLKIGGPASYLAEPRDRDELNSALEFQRKERLPFLVIGRGSNLLFSDDGFSGLVLSLRKLNAEDYSVERDSRLRVPAGMSLFRLAILCQEQSLSGAEFLCHIPGTVGGAIAMNAGFARPGVPYREIKDILESFTAIDLNGMVIKFQQSDVRFEYRKTYVPQGNIILEAVFRLNPKPRSLIREEIKANFSYRNSVQDLRFPSAGSIFKNPKESPLTSGQLLERAGMKGVRIGDAQVSERHANFFLNVGRAKAADMLELIELGRKRVRDEFGIELETEVKYIPSAYHETFQHES